MVRFRLRFLLQELDLPPGEIVLGRSASCHVTIEDPLVSRQHARLRIDGERATVEDLKSRNGLLLNGRPVRGTAQLEDGDRLRIGVQELVISKMHQGGRGRSDSKNRITGLLCHCAVCAQPYPTELIECPACGSSERADEDTLSDAKSEKSWSLELLVEVVRKAASLGRWDDVDRILVRARSNVDRLMAGEHVIEPRLLDELAESASALSLATNKASWSHWVLALYEQVGAIPPPVALRQMAQLAPEHRAALLEPASRVLRKVQAGSGGSAERAEELARAMGTGPLASGG